MSNRRANLILGQLRCLATRGIDDLSDRELLERFLDRRDEQAFARLLRRHRPLVQGVALRLVGDWQDAEDVVQATFLVLARRASTLRGRTSAAGWLYRVAYHLALKVRTAATRRRTRERQAPGRVGADPFADIRLREVQAVIDEELAALPERYRAPVLLCCLEATTRDEAARQLGWSLATLKRRLSRGRELLRARLARRGLTLAAALTPTLFAPDCGAAASLLSPNAPSPQARALAEEALQAMTMLKLKIGAVLALAAVVLVTGSGLWMGPPRLEAEAPPSNIAADRPRAEEDQQRSKDRQGDDLPSGARTRLGTVRLRQGSAIYDVALSPDGKTAISVGGPSAVRRWDTATGKELPPLQKETVPNTDVVSYSPDGRLLAAGGTHQIRLWDTSTGKLLRGWWAGGEVTALTFSADGELLASAGPNGGPRLWKTATGEEVARLTEKEAVPSAPRMGAHSLAFSPDGRRLASTYDKYVILWDVNARKEVQRLEGHEGHVHAVAFSPDGKQLASGGADRILRLWDAASGRLLRRLKPRDDTSVRGMYPADDPDVIAALLSADDGDVFLPALPRSGKKPPLLVGLRIQAPITCLRFTPDGRMLLSGSGDPRSSEPQEPHALRIWDLASGKEMALGEHGRGASALALSRDGSLLVSADGSSVRIWDLKARKELRHGEAHQDWIGAIAFSPDGRRVVTGGGDCTVRLWDAITGRLLRTLPRGQDTVKSVAFSPDGRWIAAGHRDGVVCLWDAASGREVWRTHEGGEMWVSFSADGRRLIGAMETMVLVWDSASGEQVRRSRLQHWVGGTRFYRFAVSPDARLLATGDIDTRFFGRGQQRPAVRLWDLASGQALRLLEGHEATIRALAFSPDGKLLATNEDWETRLWDVATGKSLARLRGGGDAVAFSPDGRVLATGGFDDRAHLWEVTTQKERTVFSGHRGYVYALSFTPDGSALASGSADTSALLWNLRDSERRPQPLPAPELEKRWRALADRDAAPAYRAMIDLMARPDQAVGLLRDRVHDVRPPDAERLARLLADLDAERFEVRDNAARQIEAIGELARPALEKALEGKPSLEVRRRVEQLLVSIEPANSPETLRVLRAVEVLEGIGTPEARRVLESLARGSEASRVTRDAKAALTRIGRTVKP
jgi:RNA polymerase sigma factor (sigma-70 family)